MPSGEPAPISARTHVCAVFGHPVRHSASPAMQNAGITALGLDWRYLAFEVPPQQLREALAGAAAMRFVGVNLTVPHKLLAVDMMQELDASARQWGAVNTVRFEGRSTDGASDSDSDGGGEKAWRSITNFASGSAHEVRMHGFNTDADAIVRALREDLRVEPQTSKILLLGAGGAGRVTALRLACEGCSQLWLVNRTESKAHELAAEIRRRFPACAARVLVGYPRGPLDLVLNATSAGLTQEDPLPFDPERFDLRQAAAAYDMIYQPAETRFLSAARAAGCRVANGLGMLLYQGAAALEIWSGQKPPLEPMRQTLWAHVYGPET